MDVIFVIEQEPGQSGKAQVQQWQRRLKGRQVIGYRPTTDKVARAGPFSTILEAGGAWMLRAAWNGMLLNHLSNFPSPDWHDDLIDAMTMAYYGLTAGSVKTKVVRLA
jgi:predicted phage terminase large subunit-like protein